MGTFVEPLNIQATKPHANDKDKEILFGHCSSCGQPVYDKEDYMQLARFRSLISKERAKIRVYHLSCWREIAGDEYTNI